MLFSPLLEKFNLVIPFIAFLALGLHSLLGISIDTQPDARLYLLAAIVGSGHTVFTFLFLGLWPQGRELARVVFLRSQAKLSISALVLGAIVFYFVATTYFPGENRLYEVLAVVLLALFAQHALGQMRGLSLLYNYHIRNKVKLSESEQLRFSRIEKWERRLFSFLVLVWIAEVFEQTYFDGVGAHVLNPLMFMIVVAIVLLALLLPGSAQSNKTIFLFRLFLFPFATTMPEAAFSIFFLHGLEYELTLFKLLKFGDKKIARSLWGITFLFLFVGFPLFHLAGDLFSQMNQNVVVTLAMIAKAVDHFHYYVDALIFKFKDPEIRSRILPPLMSNDHDDLSDSRRTPFGGPTGT